MNDFDPYYKWLAIPLTEQPPNHYRLLGVPLYTDDPDVIENAADQRMVHLRSFQAGQHSQASQRLLNEVAAARVCLPNTPKKSEYDVALRRQLQPAILARPLQPVVLPQPLMQPYPLPPPVRPPVGEMAIAPASVANPEASATPALSSRPTKRKPAKSPLVEVLKHIGASVAGLLCGYLIAGFFNPSWDHFELFHRKPVLVNQPPVRPMNVEPVSTTDKVESVTPKPVLVEIPAVKPLPVAPVNPPPSAEELEKRVAEEKQLRLVQLQTDRDAAIAGGKVTQALKLTAEFAQLNELDPRAEKARVSEELQKVELSAAETFVLVGALLELAQHALASNDHDLATDQATAALQLARKTSDQDQVRQATKLILEIQRPK